MARVARAPVMRDGTQRGNLQVVQIRHVDGRHTKPVGLHGSSRSSLQHRTRGWKRLKPVLFILPYEMADLVAVLADDVPKTRLALELGIC